jgi:hypothetical protein
MPAAIAGVIFFPYRFVPQVNDDDIEAIARGLEAHGEAVRAALTAATDAVYASHHGRPVPEVMEVLTEAMAARGIELTNEQLTAYAALISDGRPIEWKL